LQSKFTQCPFAKKANIWAATTIENEDESKHNDIDSSLDLQAKQALPFFCKFNRVGRERKVCNNKDMSIKRDFIVLTA
jgi:hypothetical protein